MSNPFDSGIALRFEAIEACVGLPVGTWRTDITGLQWEQKVHEAAKERRIEAASRPMRNR